MSCQQHQTGYCYCKPVEHKGWCDKMGKSNFCSCGADGIPLKPVDEDSKWTHHKDRGRAVANDSTSIEWNQADLSRAIGYLTMCLADIGEAMENRSTRRVAVGAPPEVHDQDCDRVQKMNRPCNCRRGRQ